MSICHTVKRKWYTITGMLLAALSLSGCPRQELQAEVATMEPDRRVHHRKEGFSIIPPPGYRDNGASFWHIMNFLGPEEGDFTVNINVWSHKDNGLDIEQAGPTLRRITSAYLSKYQLLEDGFLDLPHGRAYYAYGSYQWSGRKVKSITYCLRGGNGRVYAVTYNAPAESFDTHRPHFETSIQTVACQ